MEKALFECDGDGASVSVTALILAIVAIGMGLCVYFAEPLWVLPVLEWLTPEILYRVKTEKALVALSFDDGPHAEFTPQVLEILETHGAKATFFLIGERAERNPELVRRILDEGHEIGNHCWKDGSVLGHSRKRFVAELERTEQAIELRAFRRREEKDLTPRVQREEHRGHREEEKTEVENDNESALVPPPNFDGNINRGIASPTCAKAASSRRTPKLFRAPGGVAWPWQLRLARERGYTYVLGCAYPHDPMRPPVRYICWLTKKNLRPGTIVILHDGIRDASNSIEALPEILAEGARRGLKFVSFGELVERGVKDE